MSTTNIAELNKLIRQMQDESLSRSKESNKFNQSAADVVHRGVEEKRNNGFTGKLLS